MVLFRKERLITRKIIFSVSHGVLIKVNSEAKRGLLCKSLQETKMTGSSKGTQRCQIVSPETTALH